MKLMRYSRKGEKPAQARLGVLVGKDLVADLRASYARYLIEEIGNPKGRELAAIFLPPYIAQFLHVGAAAWEALSEAYGWLSDLVKSESQALGLSGEQLFMPLAECRLFAPVRGSKIIAIGRNYPGCTRNEGKRAGKVPAYFIKVPSCVVGPGRDILKPPPTNQLDCETELAVVIGRKCKHVPEDKAYDVIAGYTILNDITARDVGNIERRAGHMLLGKTLDTFAPMGPWLVTKVEIHDPMHLRIRTRVNGELRQDGNTSEMIHSIPRLVSYMSQMTLMPGDVISTGSPGGGGLARPEWFLNAGDVIEAEIDKIGTLVNAVVDEPKS
ncbi:MAG: fumarylacetoacetate hydrolase family protein [Betaproteobacteria bacterium]|nr:fumarylacetoacetate hydrolase family protein [Betaproteobacteria bacterium]